jgi:hypothetical protein
VGLQVEWSSSLALRSGLSV